MNCIFSIKKEYSDLIFDGTKPFEFRNICPKLNENDKIYLYETKSSGCGKVVGYFTVDDIEEINHKKIKIGTYLYIDTYAKLFCDKETQSAINKIKQIHFDNYYDSYALDFLFMDDKIIEEMIKTHKPFQRDFWQMSREEIIAYNALRQKQTDFLTDCDQWLNKIGFYNYYGDESTWKYQITIKDIIKFETPIDISAFKLRNGKSLTKAPQSFCYVKEI